MTDQSTYSIEKRNGHPDISLTLSAAGHEEETIEVRAVAHMPMFCELVATLSKPIVTRILLSREGHFAAMRWLPAEADRNGVVRFGFCTSELYTSYKFEERGGKFIAVVDRSPSNGRPDWLLNPKLNTYRRLESALKGLLRDD